MSDPRPEGPASSKRLVVVAGSGRSGTSSVAGVLKHLGLGIPQPEIEGNRSNPRGFFEPRWVVGFQGRLLRSSQVRLTDARPEAFEATAAVAVDPQRRAELQSWLASQLVQAPELVVKDPRNSWFLPMWQQVAESAGAGPGFLTMLRHPAEVVGSKAEYYKNRGAGRGRRQVQITRTAGWLNVCLFTEDLTRGSRRVFMRYTDLLTDWRPCVQAAADALDLSLRHGWDETRSAAVDDFLDPDLHRVHTGWDEIDVPPVLQDLAEQTWQLLNLLADAGGHDDKAQTELDDVRATYVTMYADAEALVQSTIDAPRAPRTDRPATPTQPPPPATSVRRAAARRAAAAVRRRVQAARAASDSR